MEVLETSGACLTPSTYDACCRPHRRRFRNKPFSRDAEDPRGFLDPTVRPFQGVADEHLFEGVDGGRQGLVEAETNLGLGRRVGNRERPPRRAVSRGTAVPA